MLCFGINNINFGVIMNVDMTPSSPSFRHDHDYDYESEDEIELTPLKSPSKTPPSPIQTPKENASKPLQGRASKIKIAEDKVSSVVQSIEGSPLAKSERGMGESPSQSQIPKPVEVAGPKKDSAPVEVPVKDAAPPPAEVPVKDVVPPPAEVPVKDAAAPSVEVPAKGATPPSKDAEPLPANLPGNLQPANPPLNPPPVTPSVNPPGNTPPVPPTVSLPVPPPVNPPVNPPGNLQPVNTPPVPPPNPPPLNPNPLNPVPAVVPGAAANPPNLAAEMQRIQTISDNASNSPTSSQEILIDFLNTFKKFNNDFEMPTLVANLKMNAKDQYEVEPFKLGDDDKTYFRIKVIYIVIAKSKTPPFTPKEMVLERTISTNGTTPEEAIMIASKFKFNVSELAKKAAGLPHSSDFDGMDPAYETAAASSRRFSFKFSYNADKHISHLESISVTNAAGEKKDHSISFNPENKYIYRAKSHDYEPKSSPNEDDFAGRLTFDTEEEAILYTKGYSIENENLYNQLQKENRAHEYIKSTITEIKKKEDEFTSLKATFIKEPYFKMRPFSRWLKSYGKVTQTKDSERIQSEADIYKEVQAGNQISKDEFKKLSRNMQDFVNLKNEIKSNKASQKAVISNLNADLIKLDQKLNSIKGGKLDPKDASELKELLREYEIEDAVLQDPNKTPQELIDMGKKAIAQVKKDQLQEIADKEKYLKKIQKNITEEQLGFNKRLGDLRKANQDIKMQVDQLRQLRDKAYLILNGNSTNDQKTEANKVIKSVGDLKKLEENFHKNDLAIKDLISILKIVGADKNPPQELVAFDDI